MTSRSCAPSPAPAAAAVAGRSLRPSSSISCAAASARAPAPTPCFRLGGGPSAGAAHRRVVSVGVAGGPGAGPDGFLSVEEATLVDWAPIDMHEKFLARLTISSLNLLKKVAEEEGCTVEELNAGRLTDWFTKDHERRKEDPESATLQWGEAPSMAEFLGDDLL